MIEHSFLGRLQEEYVANTPATSTSARVSTSTSSTPTTNAENTTDDGAISSITDDTKSCIVAFRGQITCKNWVTDVFFALKPWLTTATKKNFTS